MAHGFEEVVETEGSVDDVVEESIVDVVGDGVGFGSTVVVGSGSEVVVMLVVVEFNTVSIQVRNDAASRAKNAARVL